MVVMQMVNEKFLSCDWGTSSFRLRLVQASDLTVLAEVTSNAGIAYTHKRWQLESGKEAERTFFYQSYINDEIKRLEAKFGCSVAGLPLIISGMISSSIGMKELPYKKLPFKTDGSDIMLDVIEALAHFTNDTYIVSGVRSDIDVMRGEETILIGCDAAESKEAVFILPGTHSKHIVVQEGLATHFQTFMTGEFFDLLASKSILANSVEKSMASHEAGVSNDFIKGFEEALSGNLLNAAFHVRTNQLFKKNSPSENYEYLSGLVIGSELKQLKATTCQKIFLVSGQHLKEQYLQGLKILSFNSPIVYIDADRALMNGQLKIYKSNLDQ